MYSAEVDLQFIMNISISLERFSWVQRNRVATFRCPYCGDSKTNPFKTRGYFYKRKDQFLFSCKNCGKGATVGSFIRTHFPSHYTQYKLETFRNSNGQPIKNNEVLLCDIVEKENNALNTQPLQKAGLVFLSELPSTHIAVDYVNSRKLPRKWHRYLCYTDNFSDFVIKDCGITHYNKLPTDKRIIIPIRNESGEMIAFQGRALEKSSLRYITIKFDEKYQKVFGLDLIDRDLPVIVTEGAIDSMFLPNAVAICGGDISESLSFLDKSKTVVVLDNEPRSRDTINRMNKAIELGYIVFFWPVSEQYKDINDMIKEGVETPSSILEHIKNNSYSGLRAKARMSTWKKL